LSKVENVVSISGKQAAGAIRSCGKVGDVTVNDFYFVHKNAPFFDVGDGLLFVNLSQSPHILVRNIESLLQGFPKEYADRVKGKVTDRHLLMQAGNAMTVNVIELIGNCIIQYLKTKENE
jgi:DNA (cytosine-5)-methyltransferase 1